MGEVGGGGSCIVWVGWSKKRGGGREEISTDSDGGSSIEWDSDDGVVDDACPSATSPRQASSPHLLQSPVGDVAQKGLGISLRAPWVVIGKFSNCTTLRWE